MALDYSLIGERLKRSRIKKGYTQEKLAEILKISVTYLSKVETGKAHINLKRLNEICRVLDTTESYILEGVSNDSPAYLSYEFKTILKECTVEEKELIYKIATIISKK